MCLYVSICDVSGRCKKSTIVRFLQWLNYFLDFLFERSGLEIEETLFKILFILKIQKGEKMVDNIFEDFIKNTVEGFDLSDCTKSFVLSMIVIKELQRRTFSEARLIFLSFPKHFQQHILNLLEDLYLEDKLCQN